MTGKPLWIAGYPALVGGAGPELLHMIRLWRSRGVEVHCVPTADVLPSVRDEMDRLGVHTEEYRPDIFRDRIVASWCNAIFLDRLPEIMAAGQPKCVLWANCMTWTSAAEVEAHKQGWIDLHLFQSDYQRQALTPLLAPWRPVLELDGFRPYFDSDEALQGIRFDYRPPADYFGVGRVSRADPAKFAPDTWQIMARVQSPHPVKAFVLGYDAAVEAKTGPPPKCLEYAHWPAGAISIASLLGRLHCLIHKTGGSRENWPRVVLEAMAAGVPVIAENAYGLPEMIEDGRTGYLCDHSDEMTERTSELAANETKRKRIIYAARERLTDVLAASDACWRAWAGLLHYRNPN